MTLVPFSPWSWSVDEWNQQFLSYACAGTCVWVCTYVWLWALGFSLLSQRRHGVPNLGSAVRGCVLRFSRHSKNGTFHALTSLSTQGDHGNRCVLWDYLCGLCTMTWAPQESMTSSAQNVELCTAHKLRNVYAWLAHFLTRTVLYRSLLFMSVYLVKISLLGYCFRIIQNMHPYVHLNECVYS